MSKAIFKIFNASAGSGKTYTLTKEYLKIILSSPQAFRRILAITFTNKAVNEMKHRILDSLLQFALPQKGSQALPLFREVLKELDTDAKTLQNRAANTLKELLHNYAFFDISTIDKFTHRLIRTFARDLRLPQNFEVLLDNDLLLEEAVARLIQKAGNDVRLTPVLIAFALEKVDEDKSWDILFDFKKIGGLLFNETQVPHVEKLGGKNLEDFLELRRKLQSQIKLMESKAIPLAGKALEEIVQAGLEFKDFPRETLPNHFKKIRDSEFSVGKLYNNKLEENLLEGKILKSGLELPSNEFANKLLSSYLGIKEVLYQRALLQNAYGNLVPLTVLNALRQEVKNLQNERNQISISRFNTIVSQEIKGQPAPFIYERLGEKYRHYFIDEFQDTSQMQWENLIPLIDNALSGENGSLFLVGDAKQAIYRWRGGKAEQFLSLLGLRHNPFVIDPEVESLPKNYRSCEEIVAFNKAFFESTGPLLNSSVYKELFLNGASQEPNFQKGGLVQLTFLDTSMDIDLDGLYGQQVLEHIGECLEKGYSYGDICILTRKKKQGILLAEFLLKNQIPIVSSESLLLNNDETVRFLINLLEYSNRPDDLDTSYHILLFLAKNLDDKHALLMGYLHDPVVFLRKQYGFDMDIFQRSPVYDGLEYAIRQFRLVEESNAYLLSLLDFVRDVEQKDGNSIPNFLDHWEKQREKLSITVPKVSHAVQIMTIHKSKGLEFPVVIFPYATSKIYEEMDAKLWLPVPKQHFQGFSELLINKKKEVVQYGDLARELYDGEQQKLELDAFNLLYVVLTRAIKGLYIITEKEKSPKMPSQRDSYAGLFIHFLKETGLWETDRQRYLFGTLPQTDRLHKEEGLQDTVPFGYSHRDRAGFRILASAGMLWDTDREKAITRGTLMHYILGQIEVEKDLDLIFTRLVQVGDLKQEEVGFLRNTVHKVIHHPDLRTFYREHPQTTIKNEQDIILKDGTILRPDRVVLQKKKATIIDYKTGRRKEVYRTQLMRYAQALQTMGYSVENKIIVYIDEQVTTEFI